MKIKSLILFFLFITHFSFAQKEPVGLIIDFYPTVKSDEKRMILDRENQLKPLQANHELSGFKVTLVEGLSGMSLIDYEAISGRLRINEDIQFVSILYKTCCIKVE